MDVITAWIDIGSLADIPRQGARVVATPGGDIAVFRTLDDAVFALDDACPHKQGKLSQGIVHGHNVTCPLHNWVIGLEDGQAQSPDEGCVHRIQARVQDGRVLLNLDGRVLLNLDGRVLLDLDGRVRLDA